MSDNAWKTVGEYLSDDRLKRAVVKFDVGTSTYFNDYFIEDKYVCSRSYVGKSMRYAEDAAENFTLGILDFGHLHDQEV
jgi:hypothetical protein